MATLIETASAVLSTAGTTITVNTAGAPSAGEKLIAAIYHTDDFTNTPSGWTQDGEYASTGVVTIFSKTASGSEGTSFEFTAPSSGSMAARVSRYSGVGAVHAVAGGSSHAAGTLTGGSLTTSAADIFIVAAGALRSATLPVTDMTPSTGYTAVAGDLRATNSGAKAFLQVATRVAATAGDYQYIGTYTPETTTTGEATGVGYLQTNPDGTVAAVKAVGTGVAPIPAVSGSGSVTVAAVRAQGTGLAEPPAIEVITTVTGGGAASGTGIAIAPTVSNGIVGGTVVAVKATGSGTARALGVTVVETLPANVSTGRVKGRFGTAEVLVGDDDGVANLYPITSETITFTSTASVLLNSAASPDPVVILPKPIVCTLDSQGYMVDSAGHRWCDLIATDDNDLTPSGRKWTVTCSAGLGISPFAISVAGGTTVDLTTLIPT